MKKTTLSILIFLSFMVSAQEQPKLVVGIVIDQMRQDYLYRFTEKFDNGGFKRIMKDGHSFKNAHYNYVPTYTAPGHASIYTGTTPANHYIIANNWFNKKSNLSTYCVSDNTVKAIGGSEQSGKMSPKNLKATTLTDELLLSTNFRSKVVGVSIKDRGSILPAGHNPTGAYWFDGVTGNFMTSSYYTDKLPEWVVQFNNQKLVSQYLDKTWNTLLPIEEYLESTADKVPYERAFKGQKDAVFPYNLKKLVKENGIGMIRTTPFGNSIVTDMTIAALEGENLGEDETTDFLAISYSSTDYVGHAFGPNSIELQDTYLRLDKELSRLFNYLDTKLEGEYVVFLTADHGVVEVPQFLVDMKMPGGYLDKEKLEPLSDKLNDRFGEGEWILDISNHQVFLNHELIVERGYDAAELRTHLKNILLEYDEVANVYTVEDMMGNSTDLIKILIENGYNSQLSGDILISLKSGYLDSGYGKAGTSHGSGYTYDTHVPMLFFGKGIRQGSSVRRVEITDIAPTLSMLLNISLPSACTGLPLQELFD